MKRVAWSILFGGILLAPALLAADAKPTFFEEAAAKYKAGDFKAASVALQNLMHSGRESGPVLYNLGNAALKSGEKGLALVYYLRALEASPRDKDLRWNLHILKGSLADKIEDKSYFVVSAAREALGYIRSDEIMIAFSVCLALLTLIQAATAFKSGAWLGWLRVLCVTLLIVSGSLLSLKHWETRDPQAVVLDKETYAYYGPSDSETKAFLLHEGASGRVMDRSGDWIYLSLGDKKTGWVRKTSCEIV